VLDLPAVEREPMTIEDDGDNAATKTPKGAGTNEPTIPASTTRAQTPNEAR
jgi:hypothetical protein